MELTVDQRSTAQSATAGGGRTLFLTGSIGDEKLTQDLQGGLQNSGFTILRGSERGSDAATFPQATAAIAVLSSDQNSWFERDLAIIRSAHLPLLVVALRAFQLVPCLAAYRCPPASGPDDADKRDDKRTASALTWLLQVLDRPQLQFAGGSLPTISSPFWSRRLDLASVDLQRAAQAVLPLTVGGRFFSVAVAVSPTVVVAPIPEVPNGLMLKLASEDVAVQQIGSSKQLTVLKLPVALPNFVPLASNNPTSPLIAVLSIDTNWCTTPSAQPWGLP